MLQQREKIQPKRANEGGRKLLMGMTSRTIYANSSLDGLLDALSKSQFLCLFEPVISILHIESNAKKNNGKSSGFTIEKQEIFTQGRANATEVSRKGIKHLDAAKQHLEELRNQEIGLDKKIEDMKLMWEANGSNLKAVLQVHPALVEDLFPRRKAETSAAADRLDEHKVEREGSLKTFLKHANTHLSRGREHEKIATDARALIKNYKALLTG
ncbi:hypothetical protein PLEOSDRAFT_153327 [Pleurotus ostreatus PC15]|uniref:Uncharacterized protein n=1 Tax=Pleurotus ostreatus (strain PC15) TaxID=1137138 RepID=A0A067PAT8_PLEO1|nr:hypothetical protein PLEOSDRAFT_153327 [Pleurotus ostreatus PC15]